MLDAWNIDLNEILCSHRAWNLEVGDLPPLSTGSRETSDRKLLSAFKLGKSKKTLWVLTNSTRGLTILVLPGEYRPECWELPPQETMQEKPA